MGVVAVSREEDYAEDCREGIHPASCLMLAPVHPESERSIRGVEIMQSRSIKGWRLLIAAVGGLAIGVSTMLTTHVSPTTFAATSLKLAHDKPTWNDWFNAEGKAAETATGVGWASTPYADTTTYQAAIRTAGATPKVPDLYTWWSGWLMKEIVDAGLAQDVTPLWNANRKYYSKGVRAAMTFGGKVYGIPDNLAYWVVLYNKHVFAKYHLSPPTNWTQFQNINKTLRTHGVKPLAATITGRWPGFIYFEELLVRSDPQLYQRLMAGKAKYTNPGVVKVMNLWGKMIKEGDFTNPASTDFGTSGSNDLLALFKKGKVGMVQMGTWYESTLVAAKIMPGKDYGAFIMPNINPKAGNHLIFEAGPLVVASHGSNLSDAMKAATWFMSKQGQQKWVNLTGFLPARSDVKTTSPVDKQLTAQVVKGKYQLLNRYWEATPHDIVEVGVDQFDKFMLHPNNPTAILKTIQQQADKTWSSL
jgi:multiple sugar transport system substrate-binding protein